MWVLKLNKVNKIRIISYVLLCLSSIVYLVIDLEKFLESPFKLLEISFLIWISNLLLGIAYGEKEMKIPIIITRNNELDLTTTLNNIFKENDVETINEEFKESMLDEVDGHKLTEDEKDKLAKSYGVV